MDGFKNTTKMKYMCGGPVRKAMGGAIKSVAPKGVMKSAASAKQLPTPEIASKPRVQPLPPKDVGREFPRPTMEPKRPTKPTPPKNDRIMGGEPRRSDEGISAKRRLAGTAGDYAAPPEKAKTMGGEPKAPKGGTPIPSDVSAMLKTAKADKELAARYAGASKTALSAIKTAGTGPEKAKDVGREFPRPTMEPKRQVQPTPPTGAKTMGGTPRGPGSGPAQATAAPRGPGNGPAKAISSAVTAKKGVPVASKKPMIGLKTGGHVTKSMTRW